MKNVNSFSNSDTAAGTAKMIGQFTATLRADTIGALS
jgi:hypothetical protein